MTILSWAWILPARGSASSWPSGRGSARADALAANISARRQRLATPASRGRPVTRPADRLFWILPRRRDVAHVGVTAAPTAAWVAQPLREAFPFDAAPRFLIFDRAATSSGGVTTTPWSLQVEPTRTSSRSPWRRGAAERLVAMVRGELRLAPERGAFLGSSAPVFNRPGSSHLAGRHGHDP